MRQPDINRVRKAQEHLKAATTILSSIKWENTSLMESVFINNSKDLIRSAGFPLEDIINIQNKEQ